MLLSRQEIKDVLNPNVLFGIQRKVCLYARVAVEELLAYTEELENKVKQLGKSQHTLIQSRRKWKYRYYKERKKLKQAELNKRKLIEYIEKKICEYDETIIELVLQNVLEVAKGEKDV